MARRPGNGGTGVLVATDEQRPATGAGREPDVPTRRRCWPRPVIPTSSILRCRGHGAE